MPCSDPGMHHGGPRVLCGTHIEPASRAEQRSAAPAQREGLLFQRLRTTRQRQQWKCKRHDQGKPGSSGGREAAGG